MTYLKDTIKLTVQFHGVLVDQQKYVDWNERTAEDAYYEDAWEVIYFQNDAGLFETEDDEGSHRIWPISLHNPQYDPYETLSPEDIFVMFPNIQQHIEQYGTNEQKVWLKMLNEARGLEN